MNTRVCETCGEELAPDAVAFCTSCGAPIAAHGGQAPSVPAVAPMAGPAAAPSVAPPMPPTSVATALGAAPSISEPPVAAPETAEPAAVVATSAPQAAAPQVAAPPALPPLPTLTSVPPVPVNADVIVNRSRRRPFLPPALPEEDDAGIVISRSWALGARQRTSTPQLGKQRKQAGDLPSWDPLPPGEMLVSRQGKH